MQLKEIILNENVNSDKFKGYVYEKNVIYMKGYGRVDTQELSEGQGRIAAAIKEKFNREVKIDFAGRFGAVVSGDGRNIVEGVRAHG